MSLHPGRARRWPRAGRGTVRPIRTAGDPVLERACPPVYPADPALLGELRDLAATLADFRARVGFGRAIAAPQSTCRPTGPSCSSTRSTISTGS